jgi:hypothetical protein
MTDQGDAANPAPPGQRARARGPALGWLAAGPAVVALVGAALPWFAPSGQGRHGSLDIPQAYCWQAGRVGYFAPLILVILAISIVGPRHGWFGRAAPPRTFTGDGRLLVLGGVAAGAVLVLTWVLLPKSYTFGGGLSWDTIASVGYRLSRNPQPGFFLTAVAALDAVVCGVVYLLAGRREPRAAAPDATGKIDNHDGEDPGR